MGGVSSVTTAFYAILPRKPLEAERHLALLVATWSRIARRNLTMAFCQM